MIRRDFFFGALSSAALSACGGGGGGQSLQAPTVAPAPTQPQQASIPAVSKIKIECFGDSTMYGSTGTATGGYAQSCNNVPKVLQDLLGPDYEVTNSGQGGSTSTQWLWGPAAANPHPGVTINWDTRMAQCGAKFVLINTGINDAFLPNYTAADHAYNFQEFARIARLHSKVPVFMSPNPIVSVSHNSILWGLQHTVQQVATQMQVPLIDQYNTMVTAAPGWASLLPDDVHPNDDLYRFMGHTAYLRMLNIVRT